MPVLTIVQKTKTKRRFSEVRLSSTLPGTRGDGQSRKLSCKSCSQSRVASVCHAFSLRKEVIQPQVLLRLPCYDFTPIMNYTLGGCSLAVSAPTSSTTHFRDVTGGVYKARERIHRGMLIRDY